jgi:hypothetical protein
MSGDSETVAVERAARKRRRKPGAASSVALSGETAARLDRLVEHHREETGWDLDRVQIVARLIKDASDHLKVGDALARA